MEGRIAGIRRASQRRRDSERDRHNELLLIPALSVDGEPDVACERKRRCQQVNANRRESNPRLSVQP